MTGPIRGQLEEPSQVRRQGVVGSSIVGFGGWWITISRRHRQTGQWAIGGLQMQMQMQVF